MVAEHTPKLIMHGEDTASLCVSMARATGADTMKVIRRTHDDDGIELIIPDNMRRKNIICVPNSTGNPQTNFVDALSMVANAKAGGAEKVTALFLNPYAERADKEQDGRGIPMFHVLAEAIRPHCDEIILVDPHNLDATKTYRSENVKMPTNVNMAFPVAIQLRHLVNTGVIGLDDLFPVHADAGATKRITPAFRHCIGSVLGWGYSLESDDWAQAFNRRNPRTGEKKAEGLGVTGDIDGKVAVIFEDIGGTMGTLNNTARDLKKAGARAVIGWVSKPIFSPRKKNIGKDIPRDERVTASIERVNQGHIDLLLTTNAITYRTESPRTKAIYDSPFIHVMDISAYLGAYINALHMPANAQMDPNANSVSALNKGIHPDMVDPGTQKLIKPIDLKPGNPLLELSL